MNTKFAKVRKYVDENRTYLAFAAGSILTSSFIIVANRNLTLLQLTKEHQQLLQEGGAVVYELKDQTLHLMNVTRVNEVHNAL